ncbi:MAG: DUF3991 and toprim domain-containing protein [Roseburia sp.]|nr:DUF3991 and toprim domain-containing protein [Roseburia sp.]
MDRHNELYQRIKETVLISDYADEIGYTLVRKGKYYSLKEHDSVRIDPQRNCFWRNSVPGRAGSGGAFGGSIIDFVMEFDHVSLSEAISLLEKRVAGIPVKARKKDDQICPGKTEGYAGTKLRLPGKDNNMRKVFAYLIKTRCIRQEIVQDMVNRRQLYQDIYGNCVFVSYEAGEDGKAVFACRRGTNTYKPFYGDMEGCDYSKCFYVDNQAERLYVTESVIDAMSVMTFRYGEYRRWNYLALASTGKWGAVMNYITDPMLKELWIGTDNDEPGQNAMRTIAENVKKKRSDLKIICDVPQPEMGKDWNEVLVRRIQK